EAPRDDGERRDVRLARSPAPPGLRGPPLARSRAALALVPLRRQLPRRGPGADLPPVRGEGGARDGPAARRGVPARSVGLAADRRLSRVPRVRGPRMPA